MAGSNGVGVEMVENGKHEECAVPTFSEEEIELEKRYDLQRLLMFRSDSQ